MKPILKATHEIAATFAWLLLLSNLCFAQQVTIRVVNSKGGLPLAGWKVDVYFVNPTQGKDSVHGARHLGTDADGIARVTLPQPSPEELDVYAFPQKEGWYAGSIKADTSVVMQKGTQSEGTKTKGKVRAEPGQILVLAKRVTFWDKLIRTILGPLERD